MPYKNIVITPPKVANITTVQTSQFYKGFSTVDSSAGVKLYDFELVKQDLLNQFNTRKGERLMNPEFGTIIWDLIYEPLTPDLRQKISEDIDRIVQSDPRVTPIFVNVVEQNYGFLIELTLQFVNTNQSENIILTFDRSIGLAV
jgi:phage baseplate assembly protein W